MKVGTRRDAPLVKAVKLSGTLRKRPATRSGCRAVNPEACGAPSDMPYTSRGPVARPRRPLASSAARTASRINPSLSGPFAIAESEVPRIASSRAAAIARNDSPSVCNDASGSGTGAPNGCAGREPLGIRPTEGEDDPADRVHSRGDVQREVAELEHFDAGQPDIEERRCPTSR